MSFFWPLWSWQIADGSVSGFCAFYNRESVPGHFIGNETGTIKKLKLLYPYEIPLEMLQVLVHEIERHFFWALYLLFLKKYHDVLDPLCGTSEFIPLKGVLKRVPSCKGQKRVWRKKDKRSANDVWAVKGLIPVKRVLNRVQLRRVRKSSVYHDCCGRKISGSCPFHSNSFPRQCVSGGRWGVVFPQQTEEKPILSKHPGLHYRLRI